MQLYTERKNDATVQWIERHNGAAERNRETATYGRTATEWWKPDIKALTGLGLYQLQISRTSWHRRPHSVFVYDKMKQFV